MEVSLRRDLSRLSQIKESSFTKIEQMIYKIICEAILEAWEKGESQVKINIGIGDLLVDIDSDKLSCQLIVSEELEQQIINTISNRSSPLVELLEKSVIDKFENIYKEML